MARTSGIILSIVVTLALGIDAASARTTSIATLDNAASTMRAHGIYEKSGIPVFSPSTFDIVDSVDETTRTNYFLLLAAGDYFLEIDDIAGESLDDEHKGRIE